MVKQFIDATIEFRNHTGIPMDISKGILNLYTGRLFVLGGSFGGVCIAKYETRTYEFQELRSRVEKADLEDLISGVHVPLDIHMYV